jgi:membrane-associated protein
MLAQILAFLENFLVSHGYWALALTLFLENAGVPLPGETMLLFAGFLAFGHQELDIGLIIVVGTLACTLGDNLGYWIGNRGGRPFLHRYQKVFRVSDDRIAQGEKLFEHFGPATVFIARFVFGMRILAGPLAGVLCMPWRRFVLFNFLGAATWVTLVSLAGYFFGRHWQVLLQIVSRVNTVVFVVVAAAVLLMWWRYGGRSN